MPETKAHFYDVFCSIFFNQQVLEETEGCSLQAVAPGAAVLIEKKKKRMVSLREAVPQKLQLCGFNRFKKTHNWHMAWLI